MPFYEVLRGLFSLMEKEHNRVEYENRNIGYLLMFRGLLFINLLNSHAVFYNSRLKRAQ